MLFLIGREFEISKLPVGTCVGAVRTNGKVTCARGRFFGLTGAGFARFPGKESFE